MLCISGSHINPETILKGNLRITAQTERLPFSLHVSLLISSLLFIFNLFGARYPRFWVSLFQFLKKKHPVEDKRRIPGCTRIF